MTFESLLLMLSPVITVSKGVLILMSCALFLDFTGEMSGSVVLIYLNCYVLKLSYVVVFFILRHLKVSILLVINLSFLENSRASDGYLI